MRPPAYLWRSERRTLTPTPTHFDTHGLCQVVPKACLPIAEEAVGLERPVSPFSTVFLTERRSNLRFGCPPSEQYHTPGSPQSKHHPGEDNSNLIKTENPSRSYANCILILSCTANSQRGIKLSQKRNFDILSRNHYCHQTSCVD